MAREDKDTLRDKYARGWEQGIRQSLQVLRKHWNSEPASAYEELTMLLAEAEGHRPRGRV